MITSNGVKTVAIGNKKIGAGNPAYVIAEAGVNHNGDPKLAKRLIDVAKKAGADAVKFQTFTTDEIVTTHAEQAAYQAHNTGIEESQASMLKKLELGHDTFAELKKYADEMGIEFLSTPFSAADADFLDTIGVPAFKVSSGDLTNIPFLEHLAKKNKPIIISTGMATLSEIRESFDALTKAGARDVIILQCASEYPAPLNHINLRVMDTLRKEFDVPVGFSDHTEGTVAGVYAASLGASIIEKHFTLDRSLPGPDHAASLQPEELADMIRVIRTTMLDSLDIPEDVLGSAQKKPTASELVTAKLVRKGVAARVAIKSGEKLTGENAFVARPEGPIAPKEWSKVLGKKASLDIPAGALLSWDMIES